MTKPAEFLAFPASLCELAPYGPYRAVCKRVVDGDTVWVLLDLGLNAYAFESIRLLDVNAPEVNKGTPIERAAGHDAKGYLAALLPEGTPLAVYTLKDRASFGRYVGDVFSEAGSVNQKMREYLHGLTKTPTWHSWKGMIIRCTYPATNGYKNYGGRGITVCERWQLFENFLADMGERPEGKSIDRIDPDGNYEPANCRWATASEQRRNHRGGK